MGALEGPAPLAEAQQELKRSLAEENAYTLHTAPADGSCFFHSLQVGKATAMSVDLLRELLHCPWPGEAEEEHVIRAVDLLQLSLKVVPGASTSTSGMCMNLGPFVCSWCLNLKSDSRSWRNFVGDQHNMRNLSLALANHHLSQLQSAGSGRLRGRDGVVQDKRGSSVKGREREG